MKISKATLLGFLTTGLLWYGSSAQAASFMLTPTDDAETRENNPESQRGFGPAAATGGALVELAVRQQGNGNNVSLVKFSLAGVTVADVNAGRADFWLHAIAGFDNSNPDGIRVYGLNAGKDNNQVGGWDEQTVHYRDSGFHTTTTPQPTQGPLIQLNDGACGFISGGNCPPSGSPYGYGADPNLATAAPGIVYENAPYSHAAVVRSNGGDTTAAATQPAYNITATSAIYPDAVGFPTLTRGSDDVDASGEATLLGYMNWERANLGQVNGRYLHFTNKALGQDDPGAAMTHSLLASNESALKSWLISLLSAGDDSATLLLTQKNLVGATLPGGVLYGNDDPLPGRGTNKRFSSKEFAKLMDLSDAGQWAPRLFIGADTSAVPEPSSLLLLGLSLGFVTLGLRR